MAQEWTIVSEPDVKVTLQDIFFINENEGWVVGDEGLILHTTNGGDEWIEVNSGTTKDLAKVFFYDSNNGWIGTGNNYLATAGGSILKTSDGGSTWTEIDFSYVIPNLNFTYFDGIYFTSIDVGHIIAGKSKNNFILKTTDGGLSWAKKDSLITTSFVRWYDIMFYDANNGVVVGSEKYVQRYTTDGGETWTPVTINDGFFGDLRAARWLNENTIVAMGEGNEFNGVPTPIYKSTDGGASWVINTASPPNSYDRIKDAHFKNSTDGIAMGSNGFSYAFIYKTLDGGENWTPSFAPYAFGIKAISGSMDVIYALGTSSHIIKSTDFGETWNIFPIKPPSSFYGLEFIGGKGIAVTRNSDVLKNEDGYGASWNYVASSGLWDAGDMYFLNGEVGFILKENRHIVKTTDGGYTWNTVLDPIPFSSRNKVGGITFGDTVTGYAWVSLNDYDEYHVFKTSDSGADWQEIFTATGPGYLSGDIGFFDANTGFMAGPDTWLQRTTDGGSTWNPVSINNLPPEFANKDFEDIHVINSNLAWGVGNKFIVKTTDKGATWEYINHNISGIDSSFYSVSFDNTMGYVGCYDGIILKTTDGGSTWIKDESFYEDYSFFEAAFNQAGKIFFTTSNGYIIGWDVSVGVEESTSTHLVKTYLLNQNFPNPFNPVTRISYYLSNDNFIELKIFDVLGNAISTLINEFQPAGMYELDFNATDLPSGIYFYQLKVGEYRSVRKMVLMK